MARSDGRMWVIKESEEIPENSQESEIAFDLGQAKKPFKGQSKFYQVYHFLGTSLDHYLVKNNLTKELQYDLAIKMARAVYHLHAGTYSRQYEQYAHLDLKPANFCINGEGAVCLINYGFSEELPGKLTECKGSITYLPDVWQGMSKEALDILALLRSLYLPKYFKAVGENRQRKCDTSTSDIQWVFKEDVLSKSVSLTGLLYTQGGSVPELSALGVLCNLILLKYDLDTYSNRQTVSAKPPVFAQRYQRLESIGLNQLVYVQKIINEPDFIKHFEKYKREFLMLAQAGLDQDQYKEKYIEKLLADPRQFAQSYKYLEDQGIKPQIYLQKILDNPAQFKQNGQKLKNLALKQPIYIQKVLDNPALITQFEKYPEVFLDLNRLGLNQCEHIDKVLQTPRQFMISYRRLKDCGLNAAKYVQIILDDPQQFEQRCQHLEAFGLDLYHSIEKFVDAPTTFDDNIPGMLKLHAVYKKLSEKIAADQLLVRGVFGVGVDIIFKREKKTVPTGIGNLWNEITDEFGNFKWLDNANAVVEKWHAESHAKSVTQQFNMSSVSSIFWLSYRDSQTQAMYQTINQLLS
ncbi:hypothetical protein ACR9PT_13385 [Piscirickettsia salmonis]|uniref:hypothetical protein n=1 Tax=Piscirickettsia salmonis TaxID=1238 RepID=UPI003EC14148